MIEILRILHSKNEILGARIISEELRKKGYSIGERAVRYHMRILDEKGFTEKVGYSGRKITNKGIDELTKGLIFDQVDFTYSIFEEKMYNVSLDLKNAHGSVIVNVSSINNEGSEEIIKEVFEKGLAVSQNVNIYKKEGKTYIETVCGTTIDGILQKNGIISRPLCGGLLKVEDYVPIRFIEEIAYERTSITPLEAFTSHNNTSVLEVARTGNGIIPANFRLIPACKREEAIKILDELKKIGIGGVIDVGQLGESLLGIDVPQTSVGIAIIGGVAPLCAAQEAGKDLDIILADKYSEYSQMDKVDYATTSILKPVFKGSQDRVQFILDKVYNLISQVNFNPQTQMGNVIANISYIDKKYQDDAIELLNKFYKSIPEYSTFNNYAIVEEKNDKVALATICGLTVDGILTNNGIFSLPLYSGLLDIEENNRRFIELISYKGSSVDPHEIFINKDLHDINGLFNNSGRLLASVHSVPYVARDETIDIFNSLKESGFQIFSIGKPNEYIFNAKIDKYHFGYVTSGGLNPVALIKEENIPTQIKSIEKILSFDVFEKL